MTMTETPNEPPKTDKPKRKPWRRKARAPRAAAAPKPVPAEFDGLSPLDCCNDCDEKRCVISGIGVCAHPLKGGLQSSQMSDSTTLKRYNRAKRAMADVKLDLQKMGG